LVAIMFEQIDSGRNALATASGRSFAADLLERRVGDRD
jgi:hypothetical protein